MSKTRGQLELENIQLAEQLGQAITREFELEKQVLRLENGIRIQGQTIKAMNAQVAEAASPLLPKTETPRTDAIAQLIYDADSTLETDYVIADIARTLERELTAANAALAEAKRQIFDQASTGEIVRISKAGLASRIRSSIQLVGGSEEFQTGYIKAMQEVIDDLEAK